MLKVAGLLLPRHSLNVVSALNQHLFFIHASRPMQYLQQQDAEHEDDAFDSTPFREAAAKRQRYLCISSYLSPVVLHEAVFQGAVLASIHHPCKYFKPPMYFRRCRLGPYSMTDHFTCSRSTGVESQTPAFKGRVDMKITPYHGLPGDSRRDSIGVSPSSIRKV